MARKLQKLPQDLKLKNQAHNKIKILSWLYFSEVTTKDWWKWTWLKEKEKCDESASVMRDHTLSPTAPSPQTLALSCCWSVQCDLKLPVWGWDWTLGRVSGRWEGLRGCLCGEGFDMEEKSTLRHQRSSSLPTLMGRLDKLTGFATTASSSKPS